MTDKIYVDMSCDKVSGQQHMQRALLNYCVDRGLYTEKDNADVLVYVQVPFDESILNEWKTYKEQGKKIVFIHHYMSKSFYERCAIFKLDGLFDLIDYHVCISKECELYDYLVNRIDTSKIFITELAVAEYDKLFDRYFTNVKHDKSICFAGKAIKGIDKFVDFCNTHQFKKKIIMCPDIEKCTKDLSGFEVYTDKRFDSVYELMSECQYIYCPSVYNVPPFHLETCLQEAIPCGCIPIVTKEYRTILQANNIADLGFLVVDDFEFVDVCDYQKRAVDFQKRTYLTLIQTQEKLTNFIQSVYK